MFLDDGSSYTKSANLYSNYVRRNVKHLTNEERNIFFDAFMEMYHHNTSEGQKIYGGHFRGLRDFVGAHLSAAGTRNADNFHDGMGFLTQHAALTNEFELAMQSMYPKMAMPYWDYTEDGEVIHAAQNLEVAWQQDIWGKDWFGNSTSSSRMHHVTEGRFAYQKAYKSDKAGVVTNAYGYMRSPWNTGKSPWVTRVHKFCDVSFSYQSWPICADHYNLTFRFVCESCVRVQLFIDIPVCHIRVSTLHNCKYSPSATHMIRGMRGFGLVATYRTGPSTTTLEGTPSAEILWMSSRSSVLARHVTNCAQPRATAIA